jgi:CRP-like cAMP-binding protein
MPRPVEDDDERRQLARSLWLRSLDGDVARQHRVDDLSLRMREIVFPVGSWLYRAGDSAERMYFIASGVVRHGSEGRVLFGEGDVLGFVDGVLSRPHALDAQVLVETVALCLKVDDWFEFLEDNFDFLRATLLRRGAELPPEALESTRRPLAEGREPTGRGPSELVDRLLVLRDCPLLARATTQALARLVRDAQAVELPTEAKRALGPDDAGLWVVERGEATLEQTEGQHTRYEADRSGLLGGMLLLERCTPGWSLKGQRDASLLHLPRDKVFDVMEDHPSLVRSVLAYVARRIESLNRSAPSAMAVGNVAAWLSPQTPSSEARP